MEATGLAKINRYLTHDKTQQYLGEVLGAKKQSFVTNCIALVSNNVNLQACTPDTIMYSAIKATSLDLPLDNNLGFAYVLPYNNSKKGVTEAQFQMGYKGYIQLAYRSGQFRTINATEVCEGEIKSQDRLTGEIEFQWIKDDAERGKAKVVGYVSFFRLTNGFEKSFYMTIEQLQSHGKQYSKSYNSRNSNWTDRFDAMCKKTVLKLLLSKYAPLSIQMADAIMFDQAVIREGDKVDYVDYDEVESIDPVKIDEEKAYKRVVDHIKQSKTLAKLEQVESAITDQAQQDLYDEKKSDLIMGTNGK